MTSAIETAGAVFAVAGEADWLAGEAMRDGRVRYSGRLGWAQRNLLYRWFYYRGCWRIGGDVLTRARKQLRAAMKEYRRLNLGETRGIDTSEPGWRGGRATN